MARAAQPIEPARRECTVVVADLVEHLRCFAQEARVLVFVEARLGQHRRPRDRRPRRGAVSATSPEIASESRDSETSSAAPSESSVSSSSARCFEPAPRRARSAGVTMQPFDADRIGGGAAANRDLEPHERRVGRRLDDRLHESPSSTSPSSLSASSSSGSAITIVRCAGTKYVRTARATSAAVTAVSRSAIVDSRRKSPSAVS